jgi:hypothetical protein
MLLGDVIAMNKYGRREKLKKKNLASWWQELNYNTRNAPPDFSLHEASSPCLLIFP